MTVLDVIDDFVKIGLGAAIGLVASWINEKRSKQEKDRLRKMEIIEHLSQDFEVLHRTISNFAGDVRAAKIEGTKPPHPKEAAIQVNDQENIIEAKLRLLGWDECVSDLAIYGAQVHDVVEKIHEHPHDSPIVEKAVDDLQVARHNWYEALQKEYRKTGMR